jgi:hypothetical protein
MNPRLRSVLVFTLAVLAFLAPLKFSLPAILYYRELVPQSCLEWLICGWPSVVFYLLLVPIAIVGFGAGGWSRAELRLLWWPAIFLATQVLASTGSANPTVSWEVMKLFIALAVGYLLGVRVIRSEQDRRWINYAWVMATIFIVWSGISQANGSLEETRRFLRKNAPEVERTQPEYWRKVHSDRIFATFTNPNGFGGYIAAAVFMVGAWTASSWKRKRLSSTGRKEATSGDGATATIPPEFGGNLFLSGAILLALMYCLWKTQSKGAFAVLVFTLVVAAMLLFSRRRTAFVAIGVICLLAVAGFAVGYGKAAIAKGERTLGARFGYWRAAWQIGCDHPLVGTGPGTFSRLYMSYKRPADEDTKLVHNNYLQMWCDSGLPGFLAFAFWFPGAMALALRRWLREPPSERLVPILWWCAVLTFALHSLVDFDLYMLSNSWPFFLMLGHLRAGPTKA